MSERAPHILIVEARFYEELADGLAKGAIRVFEKAGATFERISVPGAFEVPGVIAFAAHSAAHSAGQSSGKTKFDGYLALGCVIRGETSHYEHICNESARALMDLAVRDGVALGNGIITVEDETQARARANPDDKDKGGEAAEACLAMIAARRTFPAAG